MAMPLTLLPPHGAATVLAAADAESARLLMKYQAL